MLMIKVKEIKQLGGRKFLQARKYLLHMSESGRNSFTKQFICKSILK